MSDKGQSKGAGAGKNGGGGKGSGAGSSKGNGGGGGGSSDGWAKARLTPEYWERVEELAPGHPERGEVMLQQWSEQVMEDCGLNPKHASQMFRK